MKTPITRLTAVLIASALSFAVTPSMAQTAPAKPSAKKQNKNDKLQTKEELRACMALRDDNNARIIELDKRAEDNRKEKQALLAAPQDTGIADSKADVDAKLAVFKAADSAVADNTKALKEWEARMADFEQRSKIMQNPDRAKRKLSEEREALINKEKGLVADRDAKYKVYEASVAQANEKIKGQGNGNAEWNKKNAALAEEQEKLQQSRDKWLAECANRRFIDTDEKEIKAGK